MKKFNGFKFDDININRLSTLHKTHTIDTYEFYKSKSQLFLHDSLNNRLVTVTTWKRKSNIKFHDDVITAYNIAYNVMWNGSLANKQKLKTEDAKFIFEQAEKLLKDSNETSGAIVVRVNTIIAIIVAVIIGLTSYVVTEWKKCPTFDNVALSSIIGLLYFYVLGFYAVRNIYPSIYYPVGSSPKDLFSDNFFLATVPDDERIVRYYVSECENYQFRAERNNYLNGKRWVLYKRILWGLLASPIVFFLIFCVITIVRS